MPTLVLPASASPLAQAKGSDLTNADVTITVAQGKWRKLPATTLSAGHTVTLSTTGAVAGDQIEITRLDVTANTYAVIDGGTGTDIQRRGAAMSGDTWCADANLTSPGIVREVPLSRLFVFASYLFEGAASKMNPESTSSWKSVLLPPKLKNASGRPSLEMISVGHWNGSRVFQSEHQPPRMKSLPFEPSTPLMPNRPVSWPCAM